MAKPLDTHLDQGRDTVDAPSGPTAMEWMAALMSVVWIGAVAAYIWTAPADTNALGLVLTLLVVFLPLALIWAAVTTLRSVRALRGEAARLQATVEAMRAAYVASQQSAMQAAVKPSVEKRLEEIAASAKHTETALAGFRSRRDQALTQPSADRKAALVTPAAARASEDEPSFGAGHPGRGFAGAAVGD